VTDSYETANLDFLSASPSQTSFNEAAGTVFWDNIEGNAPGGSFDPGESIDLLVNFTATAATQDPDRAENAASVSANGGTVNAGPAVARVKINLRPAAALRIQKRLTTPDPTVVGASVQFELTLTNAGGTVLTDVDITDTFETEFLDFVSASLAQTGVNEAIGIITWNNVEGSAPGGSFDPGEGIVITVNFTAMAVTNDPAKADNSASATADGGAVTAGPAGAAVEINAPPTTSGAPTGVSCQLIAPLSIRVTWTDGSTFEDQFQIETSINGLPFALLANVASTTQAGTGMGYTFDATPLIAGSGYEFRVRARNTGSNQTSPYSAVTTTCTTGSPLTGLGAVSGRVFLQGQASHAGAMIYLGDAPAGATQADGGFEIEGVPEGLRTIQVAGRCAIKAIATGVLIVDGQMIELANLSLPGGDVNDDEQVDLFDLVRVGANYRSSPPTDADADCNSDGSINLFDLVMVGSNYRKGGPIRWDLKGAATQAASEPAEEAPDGAPRPTTAQAPRPTIDWPKVELKPQGVAGGAPVALEATAQDDGTLVVEVTARKMDRLFGADFTLRYDPERLKVVDALPSDPGIQIQPGSAWGPSPFIPLNEADRDTSEVRFAASLLKPAEPLSGDVVLATVTFELLGGDPKDAYALTSVKLADPLGGRIDVEWTGADIVPTLDRPALGERLYLPALHKTVTSRRAVPR